MSRYPSPDVYAGADEPGFTSQRSFDRDRLREPKRTTQHPDGEHRYGSLFPGDWLDDGLHECTECRLSRKVVDDAGVCDICTAGRSAK